MHSKEFVLVKLVKSSLNIFIKAIPLASLTSQLTNSRPSRVTRLSPPRRKPSLRVYAEPIARPSQQTRDPTKLCKRRTLRKPMRKVLHTPRAEKNTERVSATLASRLGGSKIIDKREAAERMAD